MLSANLSSYPASIFEFLYNKNYQKLWEQLARYRNPNVTNHAGASLLQEACKYGDIEAVLILLYAGANVSLTKNKELSPSSIAIYSQRLPSHSNSFIMRRRCQ